MASMYESVREFHEATGLEVRDKPLDEFQDKEYLELWQLRYDLVKEEFLEFQDAMEGGNLVDVADAIMDLHYVLSGTSVSFGIPEDECFAEVQRSNMSKLGPNGEVNRRADGKILKPDTWTPPDLHSIIYGGNDAS